MASRSHCPATSGCWPVHPIVTKDALCPLRPPAICQNKPLAIDATADCVREVTSLPGFLVTASVEDDAANVCCVCVTTSMQSVREWSP